MRLSRVGLLCALVVLPLAGFAQSVISSFGQNGELICTNLQPGSTAIVEWAPSALGPWTNTWAGLTNVVPDSNGTIQVSVPMFYRVREILATPQIETSLSLVTVGEGGSTNFSVRLTAQPAGNTTVNLASANGAKVSVSPTTLTFTPANYAINQTVTVSGVSDADAANENVAVTLSAAGMTNLTVAVTVIDDETLGLETSVTTVGVNEGAQGTFGVRLTAQPAANTTVSVGSANSGKVTASPSILTFTPANYATFQTVTVTGVQDADAANESISVSASSAGLTTASVTVDVTDDDVLAIETSVASLAVGEAGSTNFTARLTAQPASITTVTVASSDTGKATASPTTLTFTTVNWSVFQTVTVGGVNDVNTTNELATVTLSGSGLSNKTVNVTVVDDD